MAFGCIGWTPAEFWSATPWDLDAAVAGLNEKNNPTLVTEEGVVDLQKMLDEDLNGGRHDA